MEMCRIFIMSSILLCISVGKTFDIGVSVACTDSYEYIIQNEAETKYKVTIDRNSTDCPVLTDSTAIVSKNQTSGGTNVEPRYSWFYNEFSKQVEVNISWVPDIDMSSVTGYILQIQGYDQNNTKTNKCITILTTKIRGRYYGNFPTDIRIECFQIESKLNQVYTMTAWPITSVEGCICHTGEEKRESVCDRRCKHYQTITPFSDHLPFLHDACTYWSEKRYPRIALLMEFRNTFDVFAHISATNLNPYTPLTLYLFASDNSNFPLLILHRNSTQSTSLTISRQVDHFENTEFYAVVYYYCDGVNSLATGSFMSEEVAITYGTPPTDGRLGTEKEEPKSGEGNHNYALLGAVAGLSCIVIGTLIAGLVFFRERLGCRNRTSIQEGSNEVMLEPANNTMRDVEDSIQQPMNQD